jgi:hypothetical protein
MACLKWEQHQESYIDSDGLTVLVTRGKAEFDSKPLLEGEPDINRPFVLLLSGYTRLHGILTMNEDGTRADICTIDKEIKP